MKITSRHAVLAILITAVGTACSKKPDASPGELVADTQETAGAAAPTVKAGDDPCALVSDAEVRAAFPGAATGKRDHSQDQYGMASCVWELPTNKLAVQMFKSTNTAKEEVSGRMLGYLDPLRPALRASIDYDPVAGLGEEAVAVAVQRDEARGVLADTAMLGIRSGDRMAVLFTSTLVDGDVAASKQALQKLGKSAAGRL